MKRGNYFGTERAGKWWRRYRAPGFFARGNGDFAMDARGITFQRKLITEPVVIAWDEMAAADLAKWHAGRWAMGRPILRVRFRRDGEDLVAGFYLGEEWDEIRRLAEDINARLAGG